MVFRKSKRTSRKTKLRDLAPSLDMQYVESDDQQVLPLLGDFQLFRVGHSRKIKNCLHHNDPSTDIKSYIFDYQYTVSSGNSHVTYKRTVFFFNSKNLGLPAFRLQPEKLLHRLSAWLGWDDIDFIEHETFSRQYHLKGDDEDLVRDTFTEEVLHYFTFQKNWCVEGLNYYLIVYRKEKPLPPEKIEKYYTVAKQIYGVLQDKGFRI